AQHGAMIAGAPRLDRPAGSGRTGMQAARGQREAESREGIPTGLEIAHDYADVVENKLTHVSASASVATSAPARAASALRSILLTPESGSRSRKKTRRGC